MDIDQLFDCLREAKKYKQLSYNAIFIWIEFYHQSQSAHNRCIVVSRRTLSRYFGLSPATINKCLEDLERNHFLTIERRNDPETGEQQVSKIKIELPAAN